MLQQLARRGNKLAISKNIPLQNPDFMVKKNGLANLKRPPQKLIIYAATILPNNSGKIPHESTINYVKYADLGYRPLQQVKIELLAAAFSLPIQENSSPRHLQRVLRLNALRVVLLCFPIIKELLFREIKPGKELIVALDRTQ